MKVEHITALTLHSSMRDTADILLPTRNHFTGALPHGKNPVLIPGTTLGIMLTVDWPIAIFTLFKGETPLLTNVCCYTREGRQKAIELANLTVKGSPMAANMNVLPTPALDQFLVTIPVLPFASPQEFQLAGEIELYIYNAIYERHH